MVILRGYDSRAVNRTRAGEIMPKLKVAELSEIPEDSGKVVDVEGHCLALFKIDGKVHTIDNTCPHRMGPLGEGDLEGRVVSCPWHGWRFDVTTGQNPDFPAAKVPCFKASVEGSTVFVEV